jgi:chemosensory pili system protein ChpA (sensor histidine kinase/response regulator)
VNPEQELVEVFLQEASEHLQLLREYAGILADPYPAQEDLERLYASAHTLKGSSGMYGFPLFSEVSAKLAHIFQYAMNAGIAPDAANPLVEFIAEAVAVLESDLWVISSNSVEAADDVNAFKAKYPFAFQTVQPEAAPQPAHEQTAPLPPPKPRPQMPQRPPRDEASQPVKAQPIEPEPALASDVPLLDVEVPVVTYDGSGLTNELLQLEEPVEVQQAAPTSSAEPVVSESVAAAPVPAEPIANEPIAAEAAPDSGSIEFPPDGDVPAEILEFFVPEAEEHLQAVTACLLSLEANANPDDINRLFRAMHTIKGSAAQVGLPRIALVAHRAEDLIGRLRDGVISPSADIVDLCLDSVDILKKYLYRQWADDAHAQRATKLLLARIDRLAPEQSEDAEPAQAAVAETAPQQAVQVSPKLEEVTMEVIESVPPVASEAAQGTVQPAAIAAATVAQPKDAEVEPVLGLKKDLSAIPQSRSVRIGLERLDRMMNAVGELVINRTRMVGRVSELERLADVLNFSKARMSDKITEFQEKYEFSRITGKAVAEPVRQDYDTWAGGGEAFPFRGGYSSYSQKFDASLAEFSELEMDRYDEFSILSRSLTEISADITEILTQLDGFVRRVDSDIDEFTKLAHRLQDEITAARMVPIGNLYTRIARTVRDAAKASNKNIEIALAGAETELDNNIIQQVADPLLHLVRNAVAHGIEHAEERYDLGKPDHGNINVRAYHRGNHIYIEVEDDGRGLDYDKIRSTAVELGFVAADDAARLTERDLQNFLFHPGFSTAPRKTELAGRGVGLDVVRSNLSALNGEIEIESQKGFGTRFTLKVPLTLIISQALFVRCGQSMFAFPLAFVEEIRRIRESDIEDVGGKLLTKVRDVVTEIVRLDRQLGLDPIEPLNDYYRLVIVNVAGRQIGIVVEEVLRKDEIVIKNMGEYLRNVKLFPGATIAPDGSLILLVDVNRLIAGEAIERRPLMTAANAARLFFPGASALASGEIPEEAIDFVPEEKVVVLADDSISVRKFVGRMLEKAGYRVKLASDGLEALEIVSQTHCDLVVTDLEMPRTNGYELMAHLHQNPNTRNIPVVVVTSRAGMKHRDKAMKQGAVDFLVKPVQEDQFVATVQRLIGPVGSPKRSSNTVTAEVGAEQGQA